MRFERSIDVSAPPARVWDVLTDVGRWHEWTSSVTSVERLEGTGIHPGARFRVVQPRIPPGEFVVTAVDPGRRFTWTTGNGVVRGVADHEVVPAGAGARVTLSVRFAGLLGAPMGWLYRRLTRSYLDLEAEGLKARSEGRV